MKLRSAIAYLRDESRDEFGSPLMVAVADADTPPDRFTPRDGIVIVGMEQFNGGLAEGLRLLLAAPNSSSGKTTVSIGLMAALRARGLRVAPFKVGPDYIDPGYHTLATGLPGRNLDAWLCGTGRIAPLFAHGAAGADVSVVEGVMGLYDGRLGLTEGRSGFGSSAHIAELIDAPVVLVMDTSGVSRTLAATAYGLANHLQAPKVAGVILNKTGSPRAVDELRGALAEVGLPVLGAIPRSRDLVVPSRHLGLVHAAGS